MIITLITLIVIFTLILGWALCAMSGASDEAMERILEEMKARKE